MVLMSSISAKMLNPFVRSFTTWNFSAINCVHRNQPKIMEMSDEAISWRPFGIQKKKLIIFFFQMAINNPYYILWVLRHILWAFRKPLSFSIVSQFFSDVSVPGAARFSFYAHINLSSETTCTVHAHRTPTPTNNCKFKKVQYTRMKRWPCVFWVFSYVINIVCTPSMHRLYDS